MKRTFCILLSFMLAVTGLVGLGVSAGASNVGDIIEFDNYPQTKVSETTALKNAANAVYTVTVSADPTEGGTVSGGGTYAEGQTATLTATPKSGYHFVFWYSGVLQVAKSASFSFTVTKDVNLIALFEKNTPYTVTAYADPAEGGTVSGGGIYSEGQTATLTATPKSGYHFVFWYSGVLQVSLSPNLSFTVTKDITLTALFEKDTSVNPTQNAKLNMPQSAEVGYKSTVTVTATAEGVPEGYYVALYDGETQLAKGDNKTVSYTMTKVKEGKTLTAKVIDLNGNVQSNADGKLEKEIKITVKTGFFDKVKAFFLGLFGLLPKVELKP